MLSSIQMSTSIATRPFPLSTGLRKATSKCFKLHLVDPAIPIISTANVPPQQYDWWTKSEIHNQGLGIIQRLPPELKEMIHSYVDFPFDSEKEADIHTEIRSHRDGLGEHLHSIPLYDGRYDGNLDWLSD
ncbi:hypothetical protein LI328DRAFT_162233 [Trichoderma asperelloides]|nr:hypothetical protein LI328DRAFT_162233 [Trichoderma asperelloides]